MVPSPQEISDFNAMNGSTEFASEHWSRHNLKLSQLRVFSENELSQIHQATLDVLWNTGMNVDSHEALGVLKGKPRRQLVEAGFTRAISD